MLKLFIMNNLKKDPCIHITGQDEASIVKKMNIYNNKPYYDSMLFDILSNLNIKSEVLIRNLLSKMRRDEFSPFNFKNNEIMLKPKIPYLPPLLKDYANCTYTLVLDLDETLIHYRGKKL